MNKTLSSALFLLLTLSSQAAIKVGDEVVENKGTRTIQKVLSISNGVYRLSDGLDYKEWSVEELVDNYCGLVIGQAILTNFPGDRQEQKKLRLNIQHISSHGIFHLSDGEWYHYAFLESADANPLSESCE